MNENGRSRILIGTVATLTGAALWGLNAVVSKGLMQAGVDTMWMVNFRMITSGFVLLVCDAFIDKGKMFDIWKVRRDAVRLLVIAVLAFGVCQLTYYVSIRYSNAGIASAIQQTAPAYVLVYVMIRERRKPTAAELVTLPMVILGSFLIATHGDPGMLAIHPLALIAGLISALMCALYITLPSELIRKYGTLQTVGWGLFLGGCFIASVCKLWNFPEVWTLQLVGGLAFIIIPGAAMAFALYLYGTSIVGPVKGGVYNLFEPVVAAVASVLILGQTFHIAEITGIVCILGGIAILTIATGKSK